ncbi:MAG: acetyl/propionyl-CoA carboxylase subuit alpha [Myxococcaceae bacterium]
MSHVNRVLVANRGEIALRIMKTLKRMGLSTVAVFSDADEGAPHVRFADRAFRLGPAPSAESYLKVEAILRAAKATQADALHPGYGFLAENPDFAEAVGKAGLTFIGPTPQAIRAMGLKREAKALVGARGVPLVPGFDGGDQSAATLKAKALELGLPVIFKPSAGGGGKGMRIVREASQLEAAIESGQREAKGSFGDPTLIIEKYLERPRHVEIQLLGDHHGNVVHLFERECSIQRRHQKVVEETPSTALTPETRAAMGKAAVEVAKAIHYTNAGTVEFILDAGGRFYFSEMNTRLQVEHRVTELVVGVDLVELQVRIARGEKLPFTQGELRQTGHAVQCRLYAEDPANGFLPSIGTIHDWQAPDVGRLLVDTGLEAGGEVSVHYDPMVAKLVTWGETRAESTAAMGRALEQLVVQGVTTNRGFLARLLRHPEYLAGRIHTGFIEERLAGALAEPKDDARDVLAQVAATLAGHEARRAVDPHLPQVPSGWRNSRSTDQFAEYEGAGRVEYRALGGGRFVVRAGGQEGTWRIVSWDAPVLTLEDPQGLRTRARVVDAGGKLWVHTERGPAVLTEAPRFPPPVDEAVKGGFMAPMPGKVVKVQVKDGERVKRGQVLLVLEAMKMEQATAAPEDGVVQQVLVREGDQVTAGQILVVMKE